LSSSFSTAVEFLPVLNKQKEDVEKKGQNQIIDVFTRLIKGIEKASSE